MKTCERCGEENDGRDGENLCQACDELAEETGRKAAAKRAAARRQRKARHEAMLDCGMVKVRGALGGTYYE